MVFSEDREKAYTLIGSKRKFSNFWLSGRIEKKFKTHLPWHKENLWGAKVNEVRETANHHNKKTYSQKDEKIFPSGK